MENLIILGLRTAIIGFTVGMVFIIIATAI
jgi:hypothetical protein